MYRKFRYKSRTEDCPELIFRKHDFHNDNDNSLGKSGINYVQKT